MKIATKTTKKKTSNNVEEKQVDIQKFLNDFAKSTKILIEDTVNVAVGKSISEIRFENAKSINEVKKENEKSFKDLNIKNLEIEERILSRTEVLLENMRDDNRIYQDQINELRDGVKSLDIKVTKIDYKVNNLENRMDGLEDDTKFIKKYLMNNLEPRISIIENN